MATKLNRKVVRDTPATDFHHRRLVVILDPGEPATGPTITIRPAGHRRGYTEPVRVLYDVMAWRAADRLMQERKEKRRAKGRGRKGGRG